MGGLGGIGSFAQGFTNSYQDAMKTRRLRDRLDIEDKLKAAKERRLAEQFNANQAFKERGFEAAETRHDEDIALRRESQEATQAHQKVLEENAAKGLALQKRGQDINIMDAWGKVLDPQKPKAMRKFMFKQLATSLEIDPKSSQYKDFEGMLNGMDDEALKDIRSSLFVMLPDATPGQIADLSKSIISGQLPMKDAVEQFQKAGKATRVKNKLSVGGGGAPTSTDRLTSQTSIMDQGTEGAGKPEETTHTLTSEQLRAKAFELAQDDEIDEGRVRLFVDLARDMDKKGETSTSLKQVVTVDDEGNRIEKWVRADQAEGMEAPSGRPVATQAESEAKATGEAIIQRDMRRLEPIDKAAEVAREVLPNIKTFQEVLKTGKFETGTLSGLRQSVGQVARLVGLPDDIMEDLAGLKIGDPAYAETLDTLSKQIGLNFAKDVDRLTNMSTAIISGAIPSLIKTPEGNQLILEVYEAKANRDIEIQETADRYIDQYKSLKPKGKPSFFEEQARIMRRPLLKPDYEERVEAAKKLGESISVQGIVDKAKAATITLKDKAGEEMDFEIQGTYQHPDTEAKTDVPMIRLRDDQLMPYPKTPKDVKKLKPGTKFIYLDPILGAVPRVAK